MDFLGIGLPELFVILILALVFIGPRDMPAMAGRVAKFLRDLRMMSEGFTTEWKREINAAARVDGLRELKEELEAAKNSMQEISTDLGSMVSTDKPTNTITPPKNTNNSPKKPLDNKPTEKTLPESEK